MRCILEVEGENSQLRSWRDVDQCLAKHWEDSQPLRRVELGRKTYLPIFSGKDAYGWLVPVEHYFKVNGIEYYDKLELVLVAMEGDALTWYMVGGVSLISVMEGVQRGSHQAMSTWSRSKSSWTAIACEVDRESDAISN